jgi:DnaJ-class molecular chaperone
MTIWNDNHKPYGTHDGQYGNTRQWKKAFEETMGLNEAIGIVKDSSPWGILGVSKNCSFEEIKKAFRSLAFKTHPDYGGTSEAFRKVNAAYIILKERFE